MSYSERLRRKVASIWELEKAHPFVVGLGDGTLPIGVFRYYLCQDYVFLVDFCRVVALAAAKAQEPDDMEWFARLLYQTLNTEMAAQVDFCKGLGISEEELKGTRPSPTTTGYTGHLLASAYSGEALEAATAVLPCSWGYAEIGRMLADRGLPRGQPFYCQWVQMYASAEFAALAGWLRSFIDRHAVGLGKARLNRLQSIFMQSSRYEYLFWDAAYRMEGWPA